MFGLQGISLDRVEKVQLIVRGRSHRDIMRQDVVSCKVSCEQVAAVTTLGIIVSLLSFYYS